MITVEQAESIWAAIVHCGCSYEDIPDTFAMRLAESEHSEFRFQGNLGFGGKFYWNSFAWRVGCYSEDQTTEINRRMDKCNAMLRELRRLALKETP